MFDALILTAALALPRDPTPPTPVHVTTSRDWAASRPNRGASRQSLAVQRAATVPASLRSFASCVLDRESGGDFARPNSGAGALNTGGSGAAGRWQFMPNWRHGLPYMIKDRLVQFGMPPKEARKVRIYLSGLHYIHKYPGVYQDIGFLEVMERGGRFHWNGGSHSC